MKVSVILPVYNGEKHLVECLESLVAQTLSEIEIICIDDGSKDNSGKILDEYSSKYPEKFKVFHIENGGVYKARERGIKEAIGEYIGFCDCDDTIKPNMYEALYQRAISDNSEMVICAYERIDEETGKVLCREMTQFGNKVLHVSGCMDMLPIINTALWNKLIKREVAVKHVHFEKAPRVAEDMMFLLSLYPYMNNIAFCEIPLYNYFVRQGSAMSGIKLEEISVMQEAMLKTKALVDTQGEETWRHVINLMAFIHFGVAATLKAAGTDKGKIKAVQQQMSKWMNDNFSGWRKNAYLKFGNVFSHRYLLKPAVAMMLYKCGLFALFLNVYCWVTETLKIDIKW